jgi:flagellar protein FliO/FliZ
MCRWLTWAALGALAAGSATPLSAQSTATPALPAWRDQASVYLTMNQQTPPAEERPDAGPAVGSPVEVETPALPATGAIASIPAASDDSRRLAPPRHERSVAARPVAQNQPAASAPDHWRSFALPRNVVFKIVSALAIVVGLFLVFAWLLRRGARSAAAGLPAEVVCVLGRVPLAARQFADLLRVGNKLVLVALTPAGPTTLTEVTDPVEVDRLVGLCQQADPHSTTKAFEQVFRQLAREPAPNGFLGNEASPAAFSPAIDAFRLPRGDAPRA